MSLRFNFLNVFSNRNKEGNQLSGKTQQKIFETNIFKLQ